MTDLSLAHPIWKHLFLGRQSFNADYQPVSQTPHPNGLPPIVIGGCGRSGTTLLTSLLSSYTQLYVIPCETSLLCPGCYGVNQNPLPLSEINTSLTPDFETLYNICFDIPIDQSTIWVEKTPRNIYYFQQLYSMLEGRVFLIEIVRNGLDVILSRHSSKLESYWVDQDRWIHEVELGRSYQGLFPFLTIRYEDLVTDPQSVIDSLRNFTGFEFFSKYDSNWAKNAKFSRDFSYGGDLTPLHTSSVSKWKSDTSGRVDRMLKCPSAVSLLKHFQYI